MQHLPELIHSLSENKGSLNGNLSFVEMLLKRFVHPFLTQTSDLENWIEQNTPFIIWEEDLSPPGILSLYLIAQTQHQHDVGDLFLEIVKKGLLSHRNVYIESFQNKRFVLKKDALPICISQLQIYIEDNPEWIQIQSNLPKIKQEVLLALSSETCARFVLENQTVHYDQKTILAYQDLVKAIQKKPIAFDHDIFHQLTHFVSITGLKFREIRQSRHIARIICSQYLIRKKLHREVNLFKEKRHLYLRLLKTKLKLTFGTKPTLGILVGIHLFHKYELFDEKHVIEAAQKLVSKARGVKDTSYSYKVPQESILTLYIELEKFDGSRFTLSEQKILKERLPDELKMRIENLIPSIFMLRNEEETMRNILILSQELKYVKDIPQVMIVFDKQTATNLHFTVLLARVLKKSSKSIMQSLRSQEPFQFIIERQQIVGYIRKKYPKEAHVFRVKLRKNPSILRADSSVNLFEARKSIVSFLTQGVGEIRDYNGGMILKQGELLARFKETFQDNSTHYNDLLDDFFYSISPIEMQATLPLSSLKILFSLFLEGIQKDLPKKENYFFKTQKQEDNIYLIIRSGDPLLLEEIRKILHHKRFHLDRSLTSSMVNFQGSYSQGYILEHATSESEKAFLSCIENGIMNWLRSVQNKQILRLSFVDIPESLDPRLRGDEINAVIIKLLYDGLMRLDKQGKPSYAVANHVSISHDQKIYEFKIRDCLWTDGSPVTAHDFSYAWMKILSPEFSTPFTYFFYSIKNAKKAKEGKCSFDQVGIKVIDDKTLQVELEYPNPKFLDLTAHSLYSPVNHRIDQIHPNWTMHDGDTYVCNGPFMLKRFNTNIELVKNPLYWDKDAVNLDQIHMYKTNDYIAAQMFKNEEIDWIGRPTRPWQPYFAIGSSEKIENYALSGIFWYYFNVEKFPFNHLKMRQAFSYAINRKEIAKSLSPEGQPATTPLPLNHTTLLHKPFPDGNIELARELFFEALEDSQLTIEDFPIIRVMYTDTYVKKIVAKIIKEQWKKAFGISVNLDVYEWNTQFAKMSEGDFQTCSASWLSWINDPLYTLEAFKYRDNPINFSKWENDQYQHFLNLANHEIDIEKRKLYIYEAEKILFEEIPFTPIFYEKQYYMKKKRIKGYYPSETGIVDFKWASIEAHQDFLKIKKDKGRTS